MVTQGTGSWSESDIGRRVGGPPRTGGGGCLRSGAKRSTAEADGLSGPMWGRLGGREHSGQEPVHSLY